MYKNWVDENAKKVGEIGVFLGVLVKKGPFSPTPRSFPCYFSGYIPPLSYKKYILKNNTK